MTPNNADRKKIWAPRVRTGCEICRARRIKCDETHPVCKRCTIGNRPCRYAYMTPSPSPSPSPAAHKVAPPADGARVLSKSPFYQKEPPGWDGAQAMRFFVDVIIPAYSKFQVVENAYDALFVPGSHISAFPYQPGFIMVMVCQRIKLASLSKQVPVKRGAGLGIEHLWQILYEQMAVTIAHLNEHINARSRPGYILSRLIELLTVEVVIVGSPWRAHLQGFFAIVNLYGGVTTMITKWPQSILALHYCFMYAIVGNTTCPATEQIAGFDTWSDEEILTVYQFTFYFEFACPSQLAMVIIRITRLRALAVADTFAAPDPSACMAREIAEDLHSFVPKEWSEPYSIPEEPLRGLLARMFKVATILYAILSLPPNLAQVFAGTDEEEEPPSNPRVYYRRILFELIEQTRLHIKHSVLSWAFAVLGAAYSDGPEEGKTRILHHLRAMLGEENVVSGATTMLELFPDFWASGKISWEDCYYKPCQVIC